jgi:prophage regulatory protein
MTEHFNNKLLRLKDVSDQTSLGKSTVRLWVAQGKFPQPIALSKTIKVWRHHEIHDWIKARDAELRPKLYAVSPVEIKPTVAHQQK